MFSAILFVSAGTFIAALAITAVVCGALGYAFRGKIHTAIGQAGGVAAGVASKAAGDLGGTPKKG